MTLAINGFDHVALSVSDVKRSITFYEQILGLSQIERPSFKFPGAWFTLYGQHALHLIEKADFQGRRDHHFALNIGDLEPWIAHLQQHGVTFKGPTQRPDGIQQIFFSDPDGNLIELDYAG